MAFDEDVLSTTVTSDESQDRTLPMTVQNMGFLLDRLGADCAPLQFIRELTVNSIEAINELPVPTGEIIWDFDRTSFELNQPPLYKLCIIDTGVGMTGPEMIQYINRLSSSGRLQAVDGNYGVGAKISAATKNPAGVLYLSWKNGNGAMIHLWRNPETGEYGLKQMKLPSGRYSHWGPVEDTLKPTAIKDHGTVVILLGSKDEDNTMEAPEGAPTPSRWIARYLNSRFFQFPVGISIRAREGWTSENPDTNVLRLAKGAEEFLERHKETSGLVDLGNAKAFWWILKDTDAVSQSSGSNLPGGHVAALYHNELYELLSARSGVARLQSFGVSLGHQRVVIYVEPKESSRSGITTNTARTLLMMNGEGLPWGDWAERFRENFPQEIKTLMDSVTRDRQESDYAKSIKDRLKDIQDLLKLKKYKPSRTGPFHISDELTLGTPRSTAKTERRRVSSGGRGGGGGGSRAGDLYTLFLTEESGVPGEIVRDKLDDINVQWVPESEMGILDRAATYIPETNTLLINQDFRVFTEFIAHWEKQYRNVPAARSIIMEVAREWFQQTLTEVIYSVDYLRGDKQWTEKHVDGVISPEGLTAAVLPRYHIEMAVRRTLGSKLGSVKGQATG
jgi:hypothetical protein